MSFYLSADSKRGAGDVHLKGDARLATGRRSGASRVSAQPQIPAGQALGAYRVLACAGKSCAAALGK